MDTIGVDNGKAGEGKAAESICLTRSAMISGAIDVHAGRYGRYDVFNEVNDVIDVGG